MIGSRIVSRQVLSAIPSRIAPALTQSRSFSKAPESFINGIFVGKINAAHVFPFPNALNDEQAENISLLVDTCTKFVNEVNNSVQNDIDSDIPKDVLQQYKDLGLFGLQVPESMEGLGLSNSQYARLVEVIGANDLGAGIVMGAHQSIGFKGILLFGTDEQKQKYLPDLASGRKIAAFALTEPSSGSDANSIKTKAVLSEDGKHYILNGSKIWISNGGTADVFTVFAQTEVDDPKNPGTLVQKITAFIVERDMGVKSGPPMHKMGIRCSNTSEVYFEDVKVPVENVLKTPGEGFKIAMNILNNGRFGMGAALTGTQKKLIQIATEHVNQRVQFGKTLAEFEVIKEKIANMTLKTYASESIAYLLSGIMDEGAEEYQIEAAISKVYASNAAWYVADETLQILGGMGYMQDVPVERIVRDIRIFRIFEGTNEVLTQFIALMGFKALTKGSVNVVSRFFKGMFGFKTVSLNAQVPAELKNSLAILERSINDLSKAALNLGAYHRKAIIDKQIVLKNVAEATIEVYAMAAVISRAAAAIESESDTKAHEIIMANTYVKRAARDVEKSIKLALDLYDDSKNTISIANEVLANGGYTAVHPLNI
eukprot:TRINITY_DN3139_c0_g1_i2.p2 TRINITY_DN3139_c0_g1~~TRINITY_DN3139_c0_g1_i2.p2  ORF type:complete len:605 (-),score=312.87 TRINITY_DN3139_c0_g1_i2:35-1828(-)